MSRTRTRGITIALLVVAALPACSSTPRAAARASPRPAAGEPGEQGDLAAIARARADSARHPYTAADVRFMTAMVGHHAQAIQMASWAATHGASPTVRTLAERIINGQRDEIATMQRWLRDRQQPVPEVHTTGAGAATTHRDAGHEMHVPGMSMPHMPGMLDETQLRRLDEARGSEFDRLFLTFMIRHHRGAVEMVKELFGSYGAGQDELVFKLASEVNVDQTTEIARMERMLADLLFEDPRR